MTESVRIFVPGVPVPKGRPRFGRGRVFTPKKTRAYEDTIRLEATLAMKGRKPLTGPLDVSVTAWLPIPASWSKRKRGNAIAMTLRPTSRPDIDNYTKSACDGCNGIVYGDDAQIALIEGAKVYSEDPGLVISVVPA